LRSLVFGKLFIPPSSVLIEKNICEQEGGFVSEFIPSDEWDLFLTLAEKYDPFYCSEVLVRFRSHAASTAKKQKRKIFDAQLKVLEKHFPINQASSGEQSIIISMLGIASKIENGSLICIDEPEVCLHPAWQEKYIKFLMNTFKDYKGCHFLIATHSPQITSKLEDKNCYVMSMDDGKLVNASTLNNKSIDFQLAHVFKSPGFKNEYLTRELISLITLISEGKGQEELYSSKITEILALKDVIDDDDPVKELIKMVESVKKEMS